MVQTGTGLKIINDNNFFEQSIMLLSTLSPAAAMIFFVIGLAQFLNGLHAEKSPSANAQAISITALTSTMSLLAAVRVKNTAKTASYYVNPEEALFAEIERLMEEEKVFLKQGLTIGEVSSACRSNRTYVSTCINNMTGVSFSDFINTHRVHHAQILLASADAGTGLSDIADQSGFSSQVSFIRNFKKVTGETPSDWRFKKTGRLRKHGEAKI